MVSDRFTFRSLPRFHDSYSLPRSTRQSGSKFGTACICRRFRAGLRSTIRMSFMAFFNSLYRLSMISTLSSPLAPAVFGIHASSWYAFVLCLRRFQLSNNGWRHYLAHFKSSPMALPSLRPPTDVVYVVSMSIKTASLACLSLAYFLASCMSI